VNPTIAIAMFDQVKFRLRNSPIGTSGSFFVRAWYQRNRPSTTTPAMMRLHTEIGPQITPQSYASASCSPKTIRNIAIALRKTPGMSKRCE
jgi:hypothetical protein